jgi:hypothetical protein
MTSQRCLLEQSTAFVDVLRSSEPFSKHQGKLKIAGKYPRTAALENAANGSSWSLDWKHRTPK